MGLQQPLYLNLSEDLNHSATMAGSPPPSTTYNFEAAVTKFFNQNFKFDCFDV